MGWLTATYSNDKNSPMDKVLEKSRKFYKHGIFK